MIDLFHTCDRKANYLLPYRFVLLEGTLFLLLSNCCTDLGSEILHGVYCISRNLDYISPLRGYCVHRLVM